MRDAVTTALSDWESFYVIVGSSGAALTGLQFVVIALVAESTFRSTSREIEAFGTPTIVHFCTVLLLSAILSAPWHALSSAALALGAVAIAGIAYGIIVIRRARRQTGYAPVLEDWLWHATLPLLSHLTLLASAIALGFGREGSLFVIAGVCVVLLFVGIHNAWDTVVYVAIERPSKEKGES